MEYDPRWPRMFEAERAALANALREDAVDIQHVGSPAVPGLAAKPPIDIAVGIRSYPLPPQRIEAVIGLGYEFMGEFGIPRRHYFRKGMPRTRHVYVLELGSDRFTGHLLFLDYLWTHPDVARAYEGLKRDLARRVESDRAAYEEGKAAFITSVIARICAVPEASPAADHP